MKVGGVKKSSSFIWTLMVKTENGKGKRKPPPHRTPWVPGRDQWDPWVPGREGPSIDLQRDNGPIRAPFIGPYGA